MHSDTLMAGGGPMTLGRTLKGQYRIEAELGHGAMGVVYRGTHIALGKTVAIKMLQPDSFNSKDARERFEREARMASSVSHPAIGQVFDSGIEDGIPYLVMEFVDGKDLSDIIRDEGPMAPQQAVAIMRQLASVLDEAHRKELVHRDIKPQNIKVLRYSKGSQMFIKVLDFGVARQFGSEQGRLTATGAVIGTPVYMAPEQAGSNAKAIDGRADLYAAGIVFYELLTGQVPFDAPSLAGVLMGHLTKPPPELPKAVPEPVRQIIRRLLKKDPADRYPDAATLDAALAESEEACRGVSALTPRSIPTQLDQGAAQGGDGKAWTWRGALLMGLGSMVIAGLVMMAVLRYGGLFPRGQRGPNPPLPATHVETPNHSAANRPFPLPVPMHEHQPTAQQGTTPDRHPKPDSQEADPAPPLRVVEKHEVHEALDEAQRRLDEGQPEESLRLARQSLGLQDTPRARKLMALSYCHKGDLENAKAALFKVASGQKRAVIEACRKHNVELD